MSEAVPAPYIKKSEIVAAIKAARPNLSGRQVWRAVEVIIDEMIIALARHNTSLHNGHVYIGGLGEFFVRTALHAPRTIPDVNHPGQVVQLPLHVAQTHWFTPCKELAEVIDDV